VDFGMVCVGALFYGHILSTAWKKGIVLSKQRPLLAFSEEAPRPRSFL